MPSAEVSDKSAVGGSASVWKGGLSSLVSLDQRALASLTSVSWRIRTSNTVDAIPDIISLDNYPYIVPRISHSCRTEMYQIG